MDISQNQFDSEVLGSEKPVLVDFWAPWCGPCRIVSPIIEEIGTEHAEKLKVVKINVDENQELAEKYNVMSIPTLLVFKGGKKAAELIGAAPKATIMTHVEPLL